MKRELKSKLARLGPTRTVDRVESGSAVTLVLRPDGKRQKTIDATESLARRGLSMLKAKRAIEAAIEQGESVVAVPTVEDMRTLASELQATGFQATVVVTDAVDVRALRTRLDLTQEQFALRFGLPLDTVQNWEQGRAQPDGAANSFLVAISNNPDGVARSLEAAAEEKIRDAR